MTDFAAARFGWQGEEMSRMFRTADVEVGSRTVRQDQNDEDTAPRNVSITLSPTLAGRPDGSTACLSDEQCVLLWQACAYAQDLIDAIASNDEDVARRALLKFIHYGMPPYLRFEETEISDWTSPDARVGRLQLADHDRIRLAADTIEASVSGTELALAVQSLVDCLGRHIQREQAWISDADLANRVSSSDTARWTTRLLADRVDLDGLPAADRDVLVLDRLQRMWPGEVVRLRASADLHELLRRQHARSPGTHVWVYEQAGPHDWLVRVTRRGVD